MMWEPLCDLFGETDAEGVKTRLRKGFITAIQGSTWGQYAKTGPGFTANDVSNIADALVRFVVTPLNAFSNQIVILSGDCYIIGREFEPYEFARHFSEDILSDSIYTSEPILKAMGPDQFNDQAIAALLLRYKYCFFAEEFFAVDAIAQWIKAVFSIGASVSAEKILHLLTSMETLRSID